MIKKSLGPNTATTTLTGMGQHIKSVSKWEELALPQDLLAKLKELCMRVKHARDLLNLSPKSATATCALFAGPRGSGKTLAAAAIANELQLELYRIDLSSLVSKYIGETEKNLRKLFDAAKDGDALLFFDEADALFGKRTEVKDAHDRYANLGVGNLLQLIEHCPGLVILATNRRSAWDAAFIRRLYSIIEFPIPSPEGRRDHGQGSLATDDKPPKPPPKNTRQVRLNQ